MSVLFLPVCTWTAFRKQLGDLLWIYWEDPSLTSYKLEKKSAAELCPSFSIAANQVQADCFSCSSGTE